MRDLGYERPIVAGEYNAPWPSLYPGAESAMNEAMAAAFASPGEGEEGATPEAGAARRTPSSSPWPHRMSAWRACRRSCRCSCMAARLSSSRPAADTFALLSERLDGAESVERRTVPGRESLFAFEVQQPGRGPLAVWERRDSFIGEDEAPVRFDWPWPWRNAQAVDAFSAAQAVELGDGRVSLRVSDTPVFLSGDYATPGWRFASLIDPLLSSAGRSRLEMPRRWSWGEERASAFAPLAALPSGSAADGDRRRCGALPEGSAAPCLHPGLARLGDLPHLPLGLASPPRPRFEDRTRRSSALKAGPDDLREGRG